MVHRCEFKHRGAVINWCLKVVLSKMCLPSYLLDAEILDISTLADDLDISAGLRFYVS